MTLSPELFDKIEITLLIIIAYLTLTSAESVKDAVKTVVVYTATFLTIHFILNQPWLNAAIYATPAIILTRQDTAAEEWYKEHYPDDKKPKI